MYWFIIFLIILLMDLIICPLQVIGASRIRASPVFGTTVVIILAISRIATIFFDPSSYILPLFLNLIIGIPIFFIGCILIAIALIKMKLYSLSDTNEDEPLNTNGIYGKIRHPIYLGEIIWPIGLVILLSKIYSILMVIGMIFYFWAYIRLEEKKLIEIHGETYKEYQKRVPMLIPIHIRNKKKN